MRHTLRICVVFLFLFVFWVDTPPDRKFWFFKLFCLLGAGHNYRGDSVWVALLFGTRFRFAKPRNAHVALQKANTFLQCKWRRSLRFPNSNVHQTGLAPISDESAHNQSKKAKNLRYSWQTKQCLKRQKQNKTARHRHYIRHTLCCENLPFLWCCFVNGYSFYLLQVYLLIPRDNIIVWYKNRTNLFSFLFCLILFSWLLFSLLAI